jgi:hypothetical protein
MQSAVGVDQQLGKIGTVSVTYLNSRGNHQFLTRNANAPLIGPNTDNSGLRPLGDAAGNVYQYVSQGIFKQNQLILNVNIRAGKALSLFGFYQLGYANSDTGGATTFPSDSYDIVEDYGRASFDVRHRLFFGGTYMTPRYGIRVSPFMVASSGGPFNIAVSQDINGDSIFNDRPSFASSAANPANVVATKYGSFNTQPVAGEKLVPINDGDGPSQFTLNLRVSKTFPFGPKVEHGAGVGGGFGGPGGGGGGGGGGRGGGPPGGGLGPGGLSGNRGGPGGNQPTTQRKYNVTFNVSGRNVFNNVNLATPVGTVDSPLFGKSNGLGGAFGGVSQSANRRIDLQAVFNF